jgi:hypothetical protein
MIPLLASVLAASFVGSPHCAAMCGGFVGFVARAPGGRSWAGLLAWQTGRLTGYLGLGALAGLLGAGLERAGDWLGIHRAAAVVAGGLMAAWGVWMLAGLRRGAVASPGSAALHRWVGRLVRGFGDRAATPRALVLGLATALLPCGYLWAFVATAAATGRPFAGSLVMLAFWAGTAPALAGVALLARRALGPLERRLPLVTAAALVVIGLLTVAGRIGPLESAVRSGAATATHDCH